jgi:peptidoglycan/LPS O-acetylase OafA/YrhL
MGAASYSVYLVHYPALLVQRIGSPRLGRLLPADAIVAIAVIVAAGAGLAFLLAEPPVLAALAGAPRRSFAPTPGPHVQTQSD